MVYQITTPLLSLLPSLAVAYAILGWSFGSFVIQYIFCSLYLIVSLELGWVLCLWYDGDHTRFSKPFALFVILNFLFSGSLVPISKFPPYFQWLYKTSYTFWAASGATLNILQEGEFVGEEACTTMATCILKSSSFLAGYLGYTPLTTPAKSIMVLVILYIYLLVCKLVVGNWTRKKGLTKIEKVSEQKNSIWKQQLKGRNWGFKKRS